MTRVAQRLRSESGFTLIETLVSIAVLGIFFAAFSTVVSSSIRHGSQIQEEAVLQTEVRAAVESMAADLRQASRAGDTTLTRLSTATGTQLTFLSPDRASTMHLRKISYQVTGGQLQRAIATSTSTAAPWSIPALSSWSTVARSLSSLCYPTSTGINVFTYYDAAGVATTVPANVKSVRICVSVATVAAPTRRLTYDVRVALRPTA
jgi:prepilin-type N-terminal cleavage/methylation domain-containing protein